MTSSNSKLDFVNVDVHTKFGLIFSTYVKDIERKLYFDVNQGPSCVGYNSMLDIVNVSVHTQFGKIMSVRSQDTERKQTSDVNQGPLVV